MNTKLLPEKYIHSIFILIVNKIVFAELFPGVEIKKKSKLFIFLLPGTRYSCSVLMSDEASKLEKTLRMLARIEPRTNSIACQSNFIVVYSFDEGTQAWKKENVEGPGFLVICDDSSRCLIICNRVSTTNLAQSIGNDFEFESQGEYLMCRIGERILGLWFPEESERLMFLEEMRSAFSKPILPDETFELSKEQMKEVLLKLVQTDKFIDILHSTYLKSQRTPVVQSPGHHHPFYAGHPQGYPPPMMYPYHQPPPQQGGYPPHMQHP